MTPSALTPAARRTGNPPPRERAGGPAPGRANGSVPRPARSKPVRAATNSTRAATAGKSTAGTSTGHRSPLRPGLAPRTARRVSGPLGGLVRGRSASPSQPPATPRRPIRQSPASPAAPRRRIRRSPASAPAGAPWSVRAAAYVRALPDHSFLDRLIRGRVWIPLLGVLLAGIVAMQVEVLKLNASTAASLQRTTTLQNERDQLQANVAQLADEQRIESLAARMGMVMPQPAQMKFLSPGAGTTNAAIANIHAPDATAFAASLPAAQNPLTAGSGGTTTATAPAAGTTAAPATAAGTTAATVTAAGTTAAGG